MPTTYSLYIDIWELLVDHIDMYFILIIHIVDEVNADSHKIRYYTFHKKSQGMTYEWVVSEDEYKELSSLLVLAQLKKKLDWLWLNESEEYDEQNIAYQMTKYCYI